MRNVSRFLSGMKTSDSDYPLLLLCSHDRRTHLETYAGAMQVIALFGTLL